MLNIIQKQTNNFYQGRKGEKPEIIVLHISTDSLASCDSWFETPESQASSHYIVGLNGEIHQYVKEEDGAWGNGPRVNPTSKIILSKPDVNPNLYSISIEHEGKDLSKGTEIQKQTSAELVYEISNRWNIPLDRDHVIGHYEIKASKPDCPATDKSVIDDILKRALVIKDSKNVVESKDELLTKLEELKTLIINF